MSASRVETESKTAAPRWETEGDDYKADLSKYPEEIKDLCPIVITTCDCRPTKFKADGKELSLKDKAGKLLELTDIGVEMVAKSSAEGRNEFKKDGKRVEAMDFEFDNVGDDAHFGHVPFDGQFRAEEIRAGRSRERPFQVPQHLHGRGRRALDDV